MKLKLFCVLLLLLSSSVICSAGEVSVIHRQNITSNASENITTDESPINFAGLNSSILPAAPNEKNLTAPIPAEEGNQFSERDNFKEADAGIGMVATGTWVEGPRLAGDNIYETFGWTRGFISSYITYNVDAENIPIAKDYNNMNTTLAVIIAVLFVIGEGLTTSVAAANYPAYQNVFGDKDFSQKKYAGGGISVIAGLGASWIFRGIITLINLVDAYMMFSVMEAIKPSVDTGIMYLAMAIIELLLFVFFFYRQMVIVAMYIVAPIYGVLWASGYFKEFIDSIGDKVLRALIMQPLCIFVTTVAILVMQVMELEIWGIKVWDADNELMLYVILLAILLYTCVWCLFGKMTLIKRTGNMLVKKAVYSL